jgi:hypothetical protein
MATTDYTRNAQRPLAEFAYELKEKYGITLGQSKEQFMQAYDLSEVQLSSVYENLFVAARKNIGKPLDKISEDSRDFSNNGDMKTTILKKDGYTRRYVVMGVTNKIGYLYVVGWNWMTNRVDFFAIPPMKGGFPKQGIKIMVCPDSGRRTGGKYNYHAYDSFEDMANQG